MGGWEGCLIIWSLGNLSNFVRNLVYSGVDGWADCNWLWDRGVAVLGWYPLPKYPGSWKEVWYGRFLQEVILGETQYSPPGFCWCWKGRSTQHPQIQKSPLHLHPTFLLHDPVYNRRQSFSFQTPFTRFPKARVEKALLLNQIISWTFKRKSAQSRRKFNSVSLDN